VSEALTNPYTPYNPYLSVDSTKSTRRSVETGQVYEDEQYVPWLWVSACVSWDGPR
jgi:hypothetical protein